MPKVRAAVLDSSPVALPSSPVAIPRPLKRSASTASLPTPPRTHHKRKGRSGSQGDDTDSASDDEEDTGRLVVNMKKKQRTKDVLPGHNEEEDSENEFWIGSRAKKPVQAPVSPPPSRRQTFVTPPPRERKDTKRKRNMPERDSPNNPFLGDSPLTPPGPKTPREEEAPVLTYIFRGQKREFPNPFYHLPDEYLAPSRLPVNDPEFEADDSCRPKLLFASARRHRRHRSSPTPKSRSRSRAHSNDSDSDHESHQLRTPQGLTFAEELAKAGLRAGPEEGVAAHSKREVDGHATDDEHSGGSETETESKSRASRVPRAQTLKREPSA
ncbi:hypothetical protein PLICRDRAFT_57566 [Plicaturopsis crispa FD-325 SS-3]|uniref:Uncharacterized protein n=1 Tax=Plicaturopsis crispa FD-325 SS-3 TaxID=944288 RepID=A0A0C9T5I0_PLICR|nr:hypothetical protein PLICRDRAFT_57566 [Plicaturopsis crispa FD-325 SS-3]